MKSLIRTSFVVAVAASPLAAQTVDPVAIATQSGVCGDAGVASAVYLPETATVEATCNEDVEGFAPLVGGLGPAALIGGIAVVLAAAGGGAANATTGTNGTTE